MKVTVELYWFVGTDRHSDSCSVEYTLYEAGCLTELLQQFQKSDLELCLDDSYPELLLQFNVCRRLEDAIANGAISKDKCASVSFSEDEVHSLLGIGPGGTNGWYWRTGVPEEGEESLWPLLPEVAKMVSHHPELGFRVNY